MGGGGTPFLATNLGCLPTSVALSREEGAQSITWHGGEETSTYPASQSREDPHATRLPGAEGSSTKPHLPPGQSA